MTWNTVSAISQAAMVSLIALAACSHNDVEAAGKAVADAYQTNYRDNVIRNWQSHIKLIPECATFRDQYATEGRKYPSAASGSFQIAMQRVKKLASQAGCVEK
jgi:hypothetical protein